MRGIWFPGRACRPLVDAVIELGIAGILAEHRRLDASELFAANLVVNASGGSVRSLSAIETAAALWSRSLGGAVVTPDLAASALTPDVLATAGRALFYTGQFSGLLEVVSGQLACRPSCSVDVQGQLPDPMTWRYRLNTPVPSGTRTSSHDAGEVLHVVYGADEGSPWRGRSPLAGARVDVDTLAWIMRRLREEAAQPQGTIYGIGGANPKQLGEADQVLGSSSARSTSDSQGLAGRTRFMRLTGDHSSVPRVRAGFQPEAESRAWASDLERRVWSAAGIPPGLFTSGGDGASQREAMRRFSGTTMVFLGALIEAEASLKLGVEVKLDFPHLRGADIQGQARSVKAMTDAGVPLADALATVGLN